MLILQRPADLANYVGKKLGTSDWIEITQDMIDAFANLTGDHQWVHVDTERAKHEGPGGKTIAHGFLVLSFVPGWVPKIYKVEKRSRALNYGVNRVRFTAMLPVGSRVRGHLSIKEVAFIEGGVRFITEAEIELEGSTRPACVAETVTVLYE